MPHKSPFRFFKGRWSFYSSTSKPTSRMELTLPGGLITLRSLGCRSACVKSLVQSWVSRSFASKVVNCQCFHDGRLHLRVFSMVDLTPSRVGQSLRQSTLTQTVWLKVRYIPPKMRAGYAVARTIASPRRVMEFLIWQTIQISWLARASRFMEVEKT